MEKALLFRNPIRRILNSHSLYSKLLFMWNTPYYFGSLSQGPYFMSEQAMVITLLRVSFVSPLKTVRVTTAQMKAQRTQLLLPYSQAGKADIRVITKSQVFPTFIVTPIVASNISLTIVIYEGLASVERFTNSLKWKLHYKTNMLMEIVLQRYKNNTQK